MENLLEMQWNKSQSNQNNGIPWCRCDAHIMQPDLRIEMLAKRMVLPTDCNNYPINALVPHASKIIHHTINNRLKPFLLSEIADEQSGLMPRRGTRE